MGNADLEARPARLCALGGGELAGANLARTAFFDEAGVGRPDEEPYVVMAGVVVDNDTNWKALEDHLWWMVRDNFPRDEWGSAFFHAHAIYNGRTPFDEAHGWDETKRFNVLEALARIPKDFNLPIIYAAQERAKHIENPNPWVKDPTHSAQVVCSIICMTKTERWMREGPAEGEVAQITFEDTQKVRKYIKEMARFLRNPPEPWFVDPANEAMTQWLPMARVVGSPNFQEKADVSLLQIADVCAYVIKRHIMGDKHIERFFAPMRKNFPYANDIDPANPMYKPWARGG